MKAKLTNFSLCLVAGLYTFNCFSCDKPVDDKKVVLFLNVNASVNEVREAKVGACETGKRFITIPDEDFITDIRYNEALRNSFDQRQEEIVERYDAAYISGNQQLVDEISREWEALENEMNNANYRQIVQINPEMLAGTLNELAAQEAAIDTIITSGHDGGGAFYGQTGDITKNDVATAMRDAYADRPDLLAQFNNILLWGCYTTTENEIRFWTIIQEWK